MRAKCFVGVVTRLGHNNKTARSCGSTRSTQQPLPWQSFAALTVAVLLTLTTLASADGKGFVLPGAAAVNAADQRVVVVWHEGREELIIETSFQGGGGDSLAWVIPVPNVPEIEPASQGLLPTLEHLFAPRLERGSIGWRLSATFVALALLIAIGILIASRRSSPSGLSWVLRVGLVIFLSLTLLHGLLPSLGTGGPTVGPAAGVRVHSAGVVGHYDTAVIAGDSASAVISWLTGHGYGIPPDAEPVFEDYIADGWVFVAVRVRRELDGVDTLTPHPLRLSFDTHRCVYPMRLTGVDQTEPLNLDLFVFAAEQATAPGLASAGILELEWQDASDEDRYRLWYGFGNVLPVAHPALRPLLDQNASGLRVGTRLRGTLTPAQMQRDIYFDFVSPEPSRPVFLSHAAALDRAIWSMALVLGWGLLSAAVLRRYGVTRHTLVRGFGLVCVAAIALAAAIYFLLPRAAETAGGATHAMFARFALTDALSAISHDHGAHDITEADIREAIVEHWTTWGDADTAPREGDVPGGYILRDTGDSLEVWMFDAIGRDHLLVRWPKTDGTKRSVEP